MLRSASARPLALAALLTLTLPASLHAQARPDASHLTCQAASALVASRGAVVINTGPATYERVVRDGSACAIGDDYLLPAYVVTKDTRACGVGYLCSPRVNRSR